MLNGQHLNNNQHGVTLRSVDDLVSADILKCQKLCFFNVTHDMINKRAKCL